MVKKNDVIAIIIIVLFIVLALIAFGIYRLVHMARNQATVSEESSGSESLDGYLRKQGNMATFKSVPGFEEPMGVA
ncbi:hypothetical protein GGR52DRAFT_574219 [Hypoxylon sp. FL1284]|nr:hypothetical protein GGR52DRAFT_574219 [Hypoxylon sp. FL1284]